MHIPHFLRKFLSIFFFSRQRRHAFVEGWTGNKIVIVEEDGTEKELSPWTHIAGLHLSIDGSGNVLRLHKPFRLSNCRVCLERGSSVDIGSSPYDIGGHFWVNNGGSLRIGKNFSCGAHLEIIGFDEPGLTVQIGDDCMFSHDILVRASDGHVIFNPSTRQVLNKSKGVRVGNHVWVGMRSVLFKGTVIPDHCVVGGCSLVTKAFTEPYSIYAGSPAIKRNKVPSDWTKQNLTELSW